jgi:hypothetical protein
MLGQYLKVDGRNKYAGIQIGFRDYSPGKVVVYPLIESRVLIFNLLPALTVTEIG